MLPLYSPLRSSPNLALRGCDPLPPWVRKSTSLALDREGGGVLRALGQQRMKEGSAGS